jgi:hypothetical protein
MSDIFSFQSTVTLGNVIEIVSLLGGGIWAISRMDSKVTALGVDVYRLQIEMGKMADVLTKLAVMDSRFNNIEEDVRNIQKRCEVEHFPGPRG